MISSFLHYKPLIYKGSAGTYVYPPYANVLGWFIALVSMLLVPGYIVFKLTKGSGSFTEVYRCNCFTSYFTSFLSYITCIFHYFSKSYHRVRKNLTSGVMVTNAFVSFLSVIKWKRGTVKLIRLSATRMILVASPFNRHHTFNLTLTYFKGLFVAAWGTTQAKHHNTKFAFLFYNYNVVWSNSNIPFPFSIYRE